MENEKQGHTHMDTWYITEALTMSSVGLLGIHTEQREKSGGREKGEEIGLYIISFRKLILELNRLKC